MSTPLLELEDVSVVRDGRPILDRLSLRIAQGEHTAVLGPNGSGKSTLLKLLTREIHPFAGRGAVTILGDPRPEIRGLRTRLAVVSAEIGQHLLTDFTGLEMAVSGLLGTYGVTFGYEVTEAMWERARQALVFVDAERLTHRRFETLSMGEARRVLIARALVGNPVGLVLDEPTSSLDLVAAHDFRETMRKIAQSGTTLILVTHHLEELIPEVGRIITLSEGVVLADGPPEAVITDEGLSRLYGRAVRVAGTAPYRAVVGE